jgi:hypothetical protein
MLDGMIFVLLWLVMAILVLLCLTILMLPLYLWAMWRIDAMLDEARRAGLLPSADDDQRKGCPLWPRM